MGPGIEPFGGPKGRQLTPGERKRLLDGVFRQTEIAQDPKRDREESIPSPARQVGERLLVSGSRSFDECNLHPRLPLRCIRRGRLP